MDPKLNVHCCDRYLLVETLPEKEDRQNTFVVPEDSMLYEPKKKVWAKVAGYGYLKSMPDFEVGDYVLIEPSMMEKVPTPPGSEEAGWKDVYIILENHVCACTIKES